MKITDIPDKIIKEYKLHKKVIPDGWMYLKVVKGFYGLPQAGSLEHDLLQEPLNKEGYYLSQIVPGLPKHNTHNIQLVLIADDFGIE